MILLSELKKHLWVIIIALTYLIFNSILIFKGNFYLNFLPVVVLIVFIALVRLNYLFFIIVGFTPLSIQFIDFIPTSPVDFAIPSEPLLFGIMIIVIFKIIYENALDYRILKHPVSIVIIVNLIWIFITSVTSSMPVVSFKFLLARIWFIITFYLFAIYIFRKTSNIKVYIWSYVIPMMVVVLYTINRHLVFGLFDREAAHFVMTPFFRDHTSYGAVSAMLFFAILGIIITRNKNTLLYVLSLAGFVIITSALILSYTRAAWISVILAFGIMVATLLEIKFKYILLIVLVSGIYYGGQKTDIIHKMERNKQASSAEISEHMKSISNIKSDKSNIERLNRWSCAIGMFKEKPLFGWGPATYMFKYAPFQKAKHKTSISTDFGNKGNAHSEYLGPLSEQGILGPVTFILVAIMSLITGFKVYFKTKDKELKFIILGLILGLCTYLVHGGLNNFLDTDKVSALFWGYIAVFVSLDIFYLQDNDPELNSAGSE